MHARREHTQEYKERDDSRACETFIRRTTACVCTSERRGRAQPSRFVLFFFFFKERKRKKTHFHIYIKKKMKERIFFFCYLKILRLIVRARALHTTRR